MESKSIVITVSSLVPNLSLKQRMNLLGDIVGKYLDYGKEQLGYIESFNNKLGYKFDDYDSASPYSLFTSNKVFFNKRDEVISFVINISDAEGISYPFDILEMIMKFESFLCKKMRNKIVITHNLHSKSFKVSPKYKTLGYFLSCLSESMIVDTEFSAGFKLSIKDKRYIKNILKPLYKCDIEIDCFWCETCWGYDNSAPFHIQVTELD